MIPLGDVIPTRTRPIATLALMGGIVIAGGPVLQIASNILAVWIFGPTVEDRTGHGRFVVFCGVCGVLSALAAVLTGSRLPLTLAGATGAAAAVIGGYFVLYRRSKVVLLVPVGLSLRTIEVGAFVFAALWFVLQVVSGLASLRTLAASPVPGVIPSWAHVAGLAAGAVAVLIFRRPERERPDWWIERQRRRGG